MPAILLKGTTLVISPLLALQADMCSDLEKRGIKAAAINSLTGKRETKKIMDALEDKSLKLLYCAPETLLRQDDFGDYWFINYLIQNALISSVVVDEGHAIVESSQDFRPKYRQLGVLREHLNYAQLDPPFTILTATASQEDIIEIADNIGLKDNYKLYEHHLYRSNLHYEVIRKDDEVRQLMSILSKYGNNSQGLIYCNTRKKCEDLQSYLTRQGFNVAFFHSTLSKKEKNRVLQGFVEGSIKIVVSTSAFGTGINVAAVRFVINIDMPPSFNDALQQMGRAGRDGEVSKCYTFFNGQDLSTMKYILRLSIKQPARLKKAYKKVEEVFSFCLNKKECRSRLLLNYYGQDLKEDCGTCDNCKN